VAQAGSAKRFVVVHVPEGMFEFAQRPAPGANTFGPIFSPLDQYRDYVSFLDGLNLQSRDNGPGGDGHHRGVPHMLTCTEMVDDGNAGGPSIDQKIASAIGGDTTFRSLQFAVRIIYGDTNARVVWGGPSQPMPPMENPWEAYDRIFAASVSEMPDKPRIDLRKSALDNAITDLNALLPRLPATDRVRMDSYQTSLRDIERRLALGGGGVGCMPPMLGEERDHKSEPLYPEIGKLQMDLLLASLECGLTNVASLQWGNSNDQCTYPWLDVNTLGHTLSHDIATDPDGSKRTKVYNWYAQQFAYMLERLQSVQEGAGTMLDNTVILWVSEFSDSQAHAADNLLWVVMGNVDGFFAGNQTLRMNGRSVNDLHTTLANAYGIEDATYGNPAYCDGAIDDLRA
jgi:hypothetical protein